MLTLTARRRHPALDIGDDRVTLARVSPGGDVQIVTSDRKLLAVEDETDSLSFTPRAYGDLANRWDEDDVLAFCAGHGETLTFADVLVLTMEAFDVAMEFPRVQHRALMATWALATYFHPLFLTFPRLALSGERESGKSKVLALLRGTAWNALLMLAPTPAVLFRLVQEFRPTLLLDEVEGLAADDKHDVLAIINAGYKAGATVARCEGERRRVVESFAVYAPLALAAIRPPNATTEDRCIPLVMQRGADRRRLNAEVDETAEAFGRIRSGSYRLLLTGWRDVADAYAMVELPEWLTARARELWKPLLAVASVADAEATDGSLGLVSDLLTLAREHVHERPGVSAEAEALLAVLADQLGTTTGAVVRPADLRERLRLRLGWRDGPSSEKVGAWLRRLGFRRLQKDRDGARYEVTAPALAAVRARYGLDAPDDEAGR